MTSILLILLTIVFLTFSQMMRVRLLNVLIDPHFSIGLRSGVFMNAICSFLNIIAPLRLGEIYRYKFLRKRYVNSPPTIVLALVLERLMDSIALISCLAIFAASITVISGSAQVVYIVIVVIVVSLLNLLQLKKIHMLGLLQWNSHLRFLTKNSLREIIKVSGVVWICYLCSGLLLTLALSLNFKDWLLWNVSSFRLFDFANGDIAIVSAFNVVFIFGFLILGVLASTLGHRSNRLLDKLTDSKSDSCRLKSLSKEPERLFSRVLFLEAPIETYWRKMQTQGTIGKIHEGGSGALIFSLLKDQKVIRKVGFGHQKSRVQQQFEYLQLQRENWSFPKSGNPILEKSSFSYDMGIVSSASPMYPLISSLTNESRIEEETLRIFQYIEAGNKPIGSIEMTKYNKQLNLLWNVKLQKSVNEILVRYPQLFTSPRITINGTPQSNLRELFIKMKSLAFCAPAVLEISNPHGDPTLGNLLLETNTNKIVGIDPNPNQIIRNSTIDHGKVLQSLLVNYEETISSRTYPRIARDQISYEPTVNPAIELSSQIYLDLLNEDLGIRQVSEIMCFTSMIRLLPYRLDQDFETAPTYIGKTIELGNSLVAKYA
jgi:hypothetical protein